MEFRKMRRKRQLLPEADTIEIMKRNTAGTLAVLGDEGYPYSVPVSYVYHDGKIIIHGAKSGHRVDAVRRCDKCSFSVIDKDQIVPEEFTTYFRSAIAFGRIRILEDTSEIREAIDILARKYTPGDEEGRKKEIDSSMPALCIMVMDIEHMTGKESIELVRMKEKTEAERR